MIFTVRVWDEVTYEIEADSLEMAVETAEEDFDTRYHATEILNVREEEE